jgi:diguanylate cyclase (GGDEF)-like protein
LRPADFCCRWGGEEFVVLLPDTDPVGALETAERLIERVRGLRLRLEGGGEVNITVSIGIATASPERAVNRKELLARADAAMLDAKRSGRNRWSVCPADDAITPTGATP